ncbi:MAG TPA: response regulator [Candidatus Nanopelagicaceae bacterium]|nr:response regulator [Candidatus Nanopelagicaceae bacterium]
MSEKEIENINLNDEKIKQYMKKYKEENDKYAVWRGAITEGFKKWLKGEKIYTRDKERISLYVDDKIKGEWQKFINKNKESFPSFSELIRQSVKSFIEDSSRVSNELSKLNPSTISNISHALKEPLTSIKGYSQLLLESDEYKANLSEHVEETIKNIFDQSNLLENIIKNFLDNIQPEGTPYDILLIEDDLATIRLITSYFESKHYICKGVVSGTKGLEELRRMVPKVILLDIILPDLSGYDICQTIKTDNTYKKIPVYFLTAISASEIKKRLNATLADGYILKPFNFSDFGVIFEILNGKVK